MRVTLALASRASSKSPKSKIDCCLSRRFRDPAVGIEQQRLSDGVDDALRVLRERNVDAGGALDLPHLAQQNVQHDAIDRVVGAVEQAGFHLGRFLAEAVNAAFALFQAVRIPRQVVVQDSGEELLEVDAFAQAVGGDEDARR